MSDKMFEFRQDEKKLFMRAFEEYIVPKMQTAKEKKAIIKKDKTSTVYFEIIEENELRTTIHFPDDLMFAFTIAIDAIYESTKTEKPLNDNQVGNEKPLYRIQGETVSLL